MFITKSITHFYANSLQGIDTLNLSLGHAIRFLILVEGSAKSEGKLSLREIPGGMYDVFRYKGSYSDLPEFYKTIYNQWFPYSMYHQKRPLTFEVYLNSPDETPVEGLLTQCKYFW